MSTHQVAKKAWREGLSNQRDRKLSQGRRSAKSLGFLAAACSLFCFSSCHSSVLKKKKKTHGCFNSSMRRAMAEAMAILEEQVPHAETKTGGIHVASLRLSPPPSPFKPIDLGTKQNVSRT